MTVSEGATPFEGSMASDPLAPMAGALATESTADPGLEIVTGTLPSPAARVTRHLNAEGPRIIANWALRVANLPAFRAVPDLGLAQLQDAIPDLLAASLTVIASSDPQLEFEPATRAEEAARRHASARARDGFGIDVVLAELQQLRAEIAAAAWRIAADDTSLATLPREIQDRLFQTTDAVVRAAADAWVRTRFGLGPSDPS